VYGPLFLTSEAFDGLDGWLDLSRTGERVLVIDSASRAIADGDRTVAAALAAVTAAGRRAERLDVGAGKVAPLEAAARGGAPAAILMTGGDPFALLAALERSGAAHLLRGAHRRGIAIAGQSAGAMVCGPSLAPLRLTSPFPAPAGLDLSALQLSPRLVLPHHDRPGRAARHRLAALRFGTTIDLMPLWDDEVLLDDGVSWALRRGDCLTRRAVPADAAALAAVFHAAAGAAWANFLDAERLAAAATAADPAEWAARIADPTTGLLVSEDAAGVCGFVLHRPAQEPDLEPETGEIDLLYTLPRVWGRGIGRRLLDRATWELLGQGRRQAVLFTEERNARAAAVYQAGGWRSDGVVKERDYLGTRIRNVRYRLDLTRYAGGA
jgi:GNAT superfamily N-acetyltransferase